MNNSTPETVAGQLFIVSAPSGGGKTSLVQALIAQDPRIIVSTSYTTRARRPGEQDGVNYYFVDEPRFQQMAAAGDFLEHASVFDHRYGTARATLEARLRAGIDVILEIDWQGARQVRSLMAGCVSIFILPPSYRILEERLRNRGDEEEAVVTRRMRDAVGEMSHYAEYDYVVINDDFERALEDLRAIVRAQRLRARRQTAVQAGLIDSLIA